ncbi:hypothetical protein EIP91_007145, partial [Steccherinum ochraceum]
MDPVLESLPQAAKHVGPSIVNASSTSMASILSTCRGVVTKQGSGGVGAAGSGVRLGVAEDALVEVGAGVAILTGIAPSESEAAGLFVWRREAGVAGGVVGLGNRLWG